MREPWLEELRRDLPAPREANVFTDPDAACACVADHNPNVIVFHLHHIWPLSWGGPDVPDNELMLCPTGHLSVHHLLRVARGTGTPPDGLPWEMRRRFGPYLRAVAQDGWERWAAAGS